MERQLRAMDPALTEENIAGKMQALEEAVMQLNIEYGEAAAASQTAAADNINEAEKTPEIKAPETTAPVATVADAMPGEVKTGVEQTDNKVSEPGGADWAKSNYVPAGNVRSGGFGEPVQAASVDNKLPGNDGVVSVDPVGADFSAEGPATADPQGMDYAETILAADPDTRARGNPDRGAKPKSGGIFTTLLAVLLAISVVVVGFYALWINKEALINAILGEEQTQISEPAQDMASDVDISPDASKDAAKDAPDEMVSDQPDEPKTATRLTDDGETVELEPVQPNETTSGQTLDQADEAQSTSVSKEPADTGADTGSQQVVELGADGKPIDGDTAGQPGSNGNDTAQNNLAPAVAQKAFLYEEGTSGAGASRDIAAFIWSLGHEVNEAGSSEAVIKGHLDVPGRNLAMSLVIKRNSDVSLPASHIIELTFQAPSDFSGGNVSDVSRFVMKTSEQGRGEGLIAVPAKISDGNFLIALNNLDQALVTNRKLLLESSWIDVPLGYTTGRRALVTLEKGALGDKVFRDAFADWEKR